MDFLYFLQQNHHPIFDFFFENISLLVNETLIITVVCYLYWCYNKKIAHKIAIGYFFSGVVVQSMKVFFRIPRPWILDSRIKPSQEMIETATGYSFPSGHTQTATSACYSLLDTINKKWILIILFIFPFFMMLSRMYVLVHSPLDVTVSFLVSASIVLFSLYYLNKDYDKHLQHILILMFILSIIGFAYTVSVVNQNIVAYELAEDSIKMMGATAGFTIGCFLETNYLKFETIKSKKILVLVIGLLFTLAIKSGLKLVLPVNLFTDYFRYFLTLFWILFLYPLILNKMER